MVDVIQDLYRIFFLDSDVPSRTRFRFNLFLRSSKKNTRETTIAAWDRAPEGIHRTFPKEATQPKGGLINDHGSGGLTMGSRGTACCRRRLFSTLRRSVLHFLHVANAADSDARKACRQFRCRFGQLFEG